MMPHPVHQHRTGHTQQLAKVTLAAQEQGCAGELSNLLLEGGELGVAAQVVGATVVEGAQRVPDLAPVASRMGKSLRASVVEGIHRMAQKMRAALLRED
jgi:hypothetical protein